MALQWRYYFRRPVVMENTKISCACPALFVPEGLTVEKQTPLLNSCGHHRQHILYLCMTQKVGNPIIMLLIAFSLLFTFQCRRDPLTLALKDDRTNPLYLMAFSLKCIPMTAIGTSYQITENRSPVFPASPAMIPDQAFVIKDNVNYKLYYAGNDFASINLAQSRDGIKWTPYASNPIISDAQYHADVKYYDTGFTGANSGTNPSSLVMNYRMWYQGPAGVSLAGWRYAESPDGITWYNRMPVQQVPATPDVVNTTNVSAQYGIADAVYTPGASNTGTDWTFRIYVNVQYNTGTYASRELVIMAFSTDGYNWRGYDPAGAVNYSTPIFTPTLDGVSFDSDHIGWFKVIKNGPAEWEAFYSGGGSNTTFQALNGIGWATSSDGITWTRRQALMTTNDTPAWRKQSVWMPSVVRTACSYQMWFLGSDNPDIGSSDWIQFKVGRAVLVPQ
jgi:hypothetical protein